jgi:glycosyltransferase involved in cell wall biosynthesis
MRPAETPAVSVIVPTYNRGPRVVQAVASALVQTWSDLEIVVVDDGSTDDTAARVAAMGDPRLRYVRRDNGGVSAARNTGLRLSRGGLVAFLDSDDLWKPDKLDRELDFLARHREAGCVFSDLEKHDGGAFVASFMRATPVFSRMREACPPGGEVVFDQRAMYLCLLQEVPILPSAFTIRRDVLDAAGHFDETWTSWEDWELFLRIARIARFGYIDQPLAVLRISADSLHRTDAVRGRATMARLLARQLDAVADDPPARAAVRAGLASLHKHMAWHQLDRGSRREAVAACARGFRMTHDVRLLARMAMALMPRGPRRALRRALHRVRGTTPGTSRTAS